MYNVLRLEKIILGTCIVNPSAWKYLFQNLNEENFVDIKTQAIVRAVRPLIDAGERPEKQAILATQLGVDEKYLDKLVEIACDKEQFKSYINIIKHNTEGLLQIDENIQQQEDQSTISENGSPAVTPTDTPNATEQCRLIDGATAIDGFYKRLKEQPVPPVATGITAIDDLLSGGMINGGLYILAANTGCGKTALALQIADAVASEDSSVFSSPSRWMNLS